MHTHTHTHTHIFTVSASQCNLARSIFVHWNSGSRWWRVEGRERRSEVGRGGGGCVGARETGVGGCGGRLCVEQSLEHQKERALVRPTTFALQHTFVFWKNHKTTAKDKGKEGVSGHSWLLLKEESIPYKHTKGFQALWLAYNYPPFVWCIWRFC